MVDATDLAELIDVAEALRLASESARDVLETPEQIRFVAGSTIVLWDVVGRGGVTACDGPKRLSRSLWNLRFVVASASGMVEIQLRCWCGILRLLRQFCKREWLC